MSRANNDRESTAMSDCGMIWSHVPSLVNTIGLPLLLPIELQYGPESWCHISMVRRGLF